MLLLCIVLLYAQVLMWSKMLRSEKNESHKRRDFLKKAIKRHEKAL